LADDGKILFFHIASIGGCAMHNYDFTPLFRHSVGFDHMQRLLDNAINYDQVTTKTYPPYNIETITADTYRISMAVAGFDDTDLDVITTEDKLTIKGDIGSQADKNYLHRGIARRSFERNFSLADYVKVLDANIENGLLHVDLIREVPESKKPRKIKIKKEPNFSTKTKENKLNSNNAKVAA
jgi:molecular chaperone IbpA